jgi:predicted phage tail protein
MIYDGEYTVIEGDFGGGGGGSAPHKPVEANDTLASKQTLKMLFAVGSGEFESIDEVYVNGTPFEAFEGQKEIRLGTINQPTIAGFEDVETPFAVSTALTYNTFITRAVSSGSVDAVRITLKLQSLYQVLDNGDRVGYSVSFRIDTRPVAGSGTWTSVGTITKSDKASSIVGFDTRVNKPLSATGAWEFRVIRLTATDTTKQSSITVFDSYTEIQDKKLTYPGTVLVGLTFTNADQLGGKIPTISFDAKAWKVKVPASAFYNPVTRVYTGVWNGAFDPVFKFSNNPAWVLYFVLTEACNIIVNSKTVIRGANLKETQLDPFSFYNEAKYYDQLIDNGHGGTEPRFTINNQFYVRENAPTFISYLLTICNANLVNQNGLVTLISDRPTATTKIINNANVIGGKFNYPGTHIDERYTWANVTFNDPDDKSNTRTISESAGQVAIDRFGFNPIDIVLVGCTSEGQARRKAKWVLEAPTAICNFSVGLAGGIYNVGEVADIMDRRYAAIEAQGLIAAATTTQITLDRPITFGAQTYTIIVYGDDGQTLLEKIINQTNTTTNTVTCSTPLSSVPIANSPFIIKGNIIPRKFKISSIEREENQYNIIATEYDTNKWARIEGGIFVTPPTGVFTNVSEFFTPAVENITFEEYFRNDGNNASGKILVKWDWDLAGAQKYAATFDVIWRRDNLPYQSLPSRQIKEAEILDTTPGTYDVTVYAVNVRGIRSLGVSAVFNYRTVAATSSLLPPTDFWVKNTVGTTYSTSNLIVTWTYPPSNDFKTDVLKDYIIEVWTDDGISKRNTYLVLPNETRGGEFNYTYSYNMADFGGSARRSVQLKVYSRDIIGDLSTAVAKTFDNPVPAAPSFTVFSGVGVAFIQITPPPDNDVVGYIVYRSTQQNFTADASTILYDGPDTYMSLGGANGTTYYYKVAAYDSFGKSGLAVSSEQSSTTLSFDVDTWSKTGVTFTPNSPGTNQVSWTAGTILKNANTNYTISAGSATWTTGILYIYFNPTVSLTALQTTTTLAIAVAASNYPLATYEGGTNIKGGDGSAFISGSQIIAGSVGASQLIAGQAVITGSAQIANGILTNAHISNVVIDYGQISDTLQSTNWSLVNHTGWKLTKTGGIITHDITVLTSTGDVALQSGSNVDYLALINQPTSVSDINQQESLILSSINSDFSESFDSSVSLSNWHNYDGGSVEISIINSTSGTFGGKVMRIGNNAGNDSASLAHKRLMPFDSTRQYRIRCTLRRESGAGLCYIGLLGVASDGVTFVNTSGNNSRGSQHYVVTSGTAATASFIEYVGYVTGFGATNGSGTPGSVSAPSVMHPLVRYIRPYVIVNVNGDPGVYEIASFIIESLPAAISGSSVTWDNLPGKPTSLSGINATEGSKLGGIQAGATVGAAYSVFTPLTLTLVGGVDVGIVGNNAVNITRIYKTSVAVAWDRQAYSNQGFTSSGVVRFKPGSSTLTAAAGISSNPSVSSGVNIDYCFVFDNPFTLYIYEGGAQILSVGKWYLTDVFEIEYKNTSVIYKQNGNIVRASTTTAGRSFYFDSSFFVPNNYIDNIQLGAYSVGNLSGQIDYGNVSTYIKNGALGRAQIGLAEIDTLRVAGQAFSFMLSVESLAMNGPYAVDQFAIVGSFTAPIEYNTLVNVSAAAYGVPNNAAIGINQEGYNIEYAIRRESDGAIVYSQIVGKCMKLAAYARATQWNTFQPYVNVDLSQNYNINNRCDFPPAVIQGNGDTVPRVYSILIKYQTLAGTFLASNGDPTKPVGAIYAGNMFLTASVLKR